MDEKITKKSPKIDKINLVQNEGKKKKHKERKKKHGTDKIFVSNEENCSGDEAAERETSSIEGDVVFARNGEEESNSSKRKKRKRGKEGEMVNRDVVDDKELQILDDNRQSKLKKRKKCNDSFTGMQEMVASKPSKKGKATEENDFKSNEGDPPLVKIRTGDANESNEGEHSVVTEVEGQGKMKKKTKKKLNKKNKITEDKDYESNEGDPSCEHSVVTEVEGQGKMKKKKKKKKLNKKSKRTEDKDYESNEGGEDDDEGKKMKKQKKKLSTKSKNKESNEFKSNNGDPPLVGVETGGANAHCNVIEVGEQGKKMKTKKTTKAGTGKSPKRVTFSDKVEICCDGFVRGKRFTPEEDEKIKEAVYNYIESHGLGDEGLDMVLHCKSYPQIKGCWHEIGAVFPERHYQSVYYRAHILFERDEKRKWSPEEYELIRKVQEQHGSNWKMIADAMGKNRFHVKDTWRRIKFTNANKGPWSQEEYQKLFDLVNLDLSLRAEQECRKSKHGMLRDNISWEAIGNKFVTRNSALCCRKWYEQLTSRMVSQGMWSDTDDYRLLNALFTLDACCMEEVDWDNLLEHRSGDVCRKRWNQMVQYIGEHGEKSFAEQVEILAKRYCPDLVEAREAFDGKPVVC